MLRIAITGKEGQVVRSLVRAASSIGVEVIPVGRPQLDLIRPGSVKKALELSKPDIIVSAAAYTAVDQAEKEPDLAMAINSQGAEAVAVAARDLGVPIIHLSTDYVFDGKKPEPYVEEDQVAPLNIYGESKLAGERAVCAVTPNHVILRTAWVYSPYGKNFVQTMLKLGSERDELRIVADQWGCPTYAPDIALAIAQMARNLLAKPNDLTVRGIFHLAGFGETNWSQFASHIFELISKNGIRTPRVIPIETQEYPTPAHRPANSRLDCGKLETLHGIRLPPWQDSLQQCLRFSKLID
jgi:dTDP-4-dehydrorhamnose reductase